MNDTISTINSSFQNSQLTKAEEYLDMQSICESFKKFECCKKNCIKLLKEYEVKKSRDFFHGKNQKDQRQYILDFINGQYPENLIFSFNGKLVCMALWCFVYGLSSSRFKKLKHDVFHSRRVSGEGDHQGGQRTMKSFLAERWLKRFGEMNGDKSPDADKIFLPSCITKQHLYDEYKEEMEEDALCRSSFYRVWKEKCSNIVIPENTRFTKCQTCSLIKGLREKTDDKEMKMELKEMRKAHNDKQMAERSVYYHHREKARKNPSKYASIIIDGMDQNKTNLPHFRTHVKNVPDEYMKIHLNGAISHGTGENFIFLDEGEWATDSTFTCNTLVLVLMRMKKENNTLPPTLYLQFDNCWRENKNENVLALCSLLVGWKLVRKVRLSFLMVGHTHEDIDQVFSNISKSLKVNDAATKPELIKVIKGSFKERPIIKEMKYVDDYGEFLGDHIYKPENHSVPHAFKFEMVDGKVQMASRMWSGDGGDWELHGELLDIANVGQKIKMKRPTFQTNDLVEIAKKVKNKHSVFSEQQRAEWERMMKNQQENMTFWEKLDMDKTIGDCRLLKLNKQETEKTKKRKIEESKTLEKLESMTSKEKKKIKLQEKTKASE